MKPITQAERERWRREFDRAWPTLDGYVEVERGVINRLLLALDAADALAEAVREHKNGRTHGEILMRLAVYRERVER